MYRKASLRQCLDGLDIQSCFSNVHVLFINCYFFFSSKLFGAGGGGGGGGGGLIERSLQEKQENVRQANKLAM